MIKQGPSSVKNIFRRQLIQWLLKTYWIIHEERDTTIGTIISSLPVLLRNV